MPKRTSNTGNERFIVDNSDDDWKVLRYLKGRVAGTGTVTVTENEILTALNKPEDFILAIVEIDGEVTYPRYLRQPFQREPDSGMTSVNYDLGELLSRAEEPA